MTLSPRITLITLGVADVAASTAFYQRLGWRLSPASNEHISFFGLDGTKLGLFSRQSLADDAHVENSPPGFSGVTLAHNCNSQAEVDAAYAFALSCGATAAKMPEKVFWGGYSGYFADPDGHLWELAFNPFMPLGEDGQMTLP
ncbi:MAG: VOC family protein [Phyllobacteriaceae bacterium]|nr:VOC family protein [Phyllobacteriaceae bacterium]